MIDAAKISAICDILELMQDGDELVLQARITPDRLDEILAIGGELEDLEDNHDLEIDTVAYH